MFITPGFSSIQYGALAATTPATPIPATYYGYGSLQVARVSCRKALGANSGTSAKISERSEIVKLKSFATRFKVKSL